MPEELFSIEINLFGIELEFGNGNFFRSHLGFHLNKPIRLSCGRRRGPPPGSGVEETKDGSTEPPSTTPHPTTQVTDLLNLADLAVEDSASSTPQTTSSA